jgi:hypothetical protein
VRAAPVAALRSHRASGGGGPLPEHQRSCPVAWCLSAGPRPGSEGDQAATAGRLMMGSLLIGSRELAPEIRTVA